MTQRKCQIRDEIFYANDGLVLQAHTQVHSVEVKRLMDIAHSSDLLSDPKNQDQCPLSAEQVTMGSESREIAQFLWSPACTVPQKRFSAAIRPHRRIRS